MARPPAPREVQALKGDFKNNARRYQKEVPKSEKPLGNVPKHCSVGAGRIWKELAGKAPPGVLTESERFIMEITCELMAEFREDPRRFAGAKFTQLISCLGRLGLTPSDRVKLGVNQITESDNEFNRF